ncbi:MAG: NUDIX domain-containing protein [Chloroflexota bacterium]|nr:NUDIX domain-containing protein [Chloroflexota bacterium]
MSLDATAVVIKDEEVLLVRLDDFKVWALPGGRVEADESVAQAAVREVYEETGIRVVLTALVGIYARPRWIDNRHSVVFAARPLGGVLQPQPGEAAEAGYFRGEAIPERVAWWHRQPIRDALRGVRGRAVWQQDMRWPYGWMSPQEMFALRAAGALPESLIREGWELWCREPQPGEQWREIEEE